MNKKYLFLLAALFLFMSCATAQSVKEAKGKGLIVIYAASSADIWAAMPDALKEINAFDVAENRAENFIYAKIPMSVMARINSYGMAHHLSIAIFIEPMTEKQTSVEVTCQRTEGVNVNYSDVHWTLDKKFKRIE